MKACKHKFKPRYDYIFPAELFKARFTCEFTPKKLRNQVYIHDICVKCGKIINRGKL